MTVVQYICDSAGQVKHESLTFYSVISVSCQKLLNSKPRPGYHHKTCKLHARLFLVHLAFQMLSSMTFRKIFSLCTSRWLCTAEGKAVLYALRLDPSPDLLLLKGQQGRRDLYKGKTEPPLAFSLCAGLSPLNLPILLPMLPLLNRESFQFSWDRAGLRRCPPVMLNGHTSWVSVISFMAGGTATVSGFT